VRGVVAVETPDAALGGGAADPGRAEPPDDGAVDRLALVLDGFGGVDHELLPQGHAVLVAAGRRLRGGEALAVAFADADALEGEQRAVKQRAELGQDPADLLAWADGDDHHRDLGVPAEEGRPFAAAVRGAVDAEQCGGAVDASAVQQVADRDEGGHAVGPLLAAQVDGQLGCVGQGGGAQVQGGGGSGGVGQQPGSLQGDQPGVVELDGLGENRLDAGAGVDRDRDQREVLGQGQGAVGAQVVLEPEPLGAAQQDAGRDLMPSVQLEQGVRDERAPASVTLAEVAGQLQAVGGHRCTPMRRPSAAAARPAARLAITLTAAWRCCRSSVSRWVSSIHVENVV
jgi:hypothetical protein